MSGVWLQIECQHLIFVLTYFTLKFIGPMSDNLQQQYGDYGGNPDFEYGTTPYQSLAGLFSQAMMVTGCQTNW